VTRREHIEQLAREAGAPIYYSGTRYNMGANILDRELYLAPWDGDVPESELYWVSLHELGHLATTEPRLFQKTWQRIEDEALAWVWALDNSAFPVDQAAESSIAWGITDYMRNREFRPSDALRRLYETLGPDPDWFMNVVTDEHYEKLDGWARPNWARLGKALAGAVQ
jgi:hypothetical protein